MLHLNLLPYVFLGLTLLACPTYGLPQLENLKVQKRVDCDPISKYTTDWFYKNVCNRPTTEQECLFYTRGLSKQAIELSEKPNSFLTTIWRMWDRSLYILDDVDDNPIRCIAKDDAQRQKYFENMSRATAKMCDGPDASVMDRDIHNVYMDSIWGKVEFEQLKKTDNPVTQLVDHIEAVTELGDDSAGFWDRNPTTTKRDAKDAIFTAERRASCGVGADIAVQIDVGGKWPVEW